MLIGCFGESRSIDVASDESSGKQSLIDGLRAHIDRIEGGATFSAVSSSSSNHWTLGVPEIDTLLGPVGLDAGGVHEIRCAAPGGRGLHAAAATIAKRTVAFLFGVRRIINLEDAGPILWATTFNTSHEAGTPYSHGLQGLGLDPDHLIIVTPRKNQDVLWVLEEALRSGCVSMVLGEVGVVSATASRRLSLAAAEAQCPCILLSSPGSLPAVAVATRWQVAPRPGGENRLDPAAPGARRFSLTLERCRSQPLVSNRIDFAVEWSDDARCFRMVASVPDRASAPEFAAFPPHEIQRRIA